ncbi:MAG: nucleoside-diphosphate kinase [Candidatus Thorarchaeota archaeon]
MSSGNPENDSERSLLLIKPDGVRRGLIGQVIARVESKGLEIIGLKMVHLTDSQIDRLYDIHIGKEFYPDLKSFIGSGPVVAIAVQGTNAVKVVRKLLGATNSIEALPGTIRGDFGLALTKNIAHGSDAPERAQYELSIFFPPEISGKASLDKL